MFVICMYKQYIHVAAMSKSFTSIQWHGYVGQIGWVFGRVSIEASLRWTGKALFLSFFLDIGVLSFAIENNGIGGYTTE